MIVKKPIDAKVTTLHCNQNCTFSSVSWSIFLKKIWRTQVLFMGPLKLHFLATEPFDPHICWSCVHKDWLGFEPTTVCAKCSTAVSHSALGPGQRPPFGGGGISTGVLYSSASTPWEVSGSDFDHFKKSYLLQLDILINISWISFKLCGVNCLTVTIFWVTRHLLTDIPYEVRVHN